MGLPTWLSAVPFLGGSGAPSSCRCGHRAQVHEHYRSGSDCALCGCLRFKRGASAPVADVTPLVTPAPLTLAPVGATGGDAHEQPGAA